MCAHLLPGCGALEVPQQRGRVRSPLVRALLGPSLIRIGRHLHLPAQLLDQSQDSITTVEPIAGRHVNR
jgi:hypothetical protein